VSARGSVLKRADGIELGATAGGRVPEAIISRPPWKSWHTSRVPCSWTAALIRRHTGTIAGR
jgi:hypothetical protein